MSSYLKIEGTDRIEYDCPSLWHLSEIVVYFLIFFVIIIQSFVI